jgi:hypothetical protein
MIKRMNRIWIVLFIIAAIGMLASGLDVNTFGSDGKNGTGLNTSYGNNTTVAGERTFLNFTFNASNDTCANITSLDISFPDGFNLTPISNDSANITLTGFNSNIDAKNCTIIGTKVLEITNSTAGGCICNTTSGSYFSVNLTNTSNFIIPTSSGTYPIILSVTNATDCVAETTVYLTVNPVTVNPGPGPNITGIGPDSSDISDHEGAARTFNITVNQTVDISWTVNGTVLRTNADTTSGTYTNSNARPGIHTVQAVATNPNGTDTQTWNWTVIANGSIRGKITDSRTGEPISYANISAVKKSGDTVITVSSRSDGTYVIPSIINGTYTLNVSEHDYKWNNGSTVIVLPGKLNSNGNVALSPDMVILSIKPGESTVKAAVAGNATIFNLTATNYGDNATFEVNYSFWGMQPGETIKINGNDTISFSLNNNNEYENFNVSINCSTANYFWIEIIVKNSSSGKSARIDLYSTMLNQTDYKTFGDCNIDSNASVIGGAVLNNSNVSSYATIDASMLWNSSVTENVTVQGGSVIYSEIIGSRSNINNGALIIDSLIDNSTVSNSEIYGSYLIGCTITDVILYCEDEVEFINATITADSSGKARITGGTNAEINIKDELIFTNIYSTILIEDLIKEIASMHIPADTPTIITESNTVDCDLNITANDPISIRMVRTGLNPDGKGSDVTRSTVLGDFLHIYCNESAVENAKLRMYYDDPTGSYETVDIYYYNNLSSTWEKLATIKETSSGRTYYETQGLDHFSTFALMGVTSEPSSGGSSGDTSGSSGSSSSGSSKYSWTTSTQTPTSTESEDATTGQPTPTKTVGEVSTEDVQATQTPTPTETEDGGIPGFTSIMFIAGLLAAAYIIMRKKG